MANLKTSSVLTMGGGGGGGSVCHARAVYRPRGRRILGMDKRGGGGGGARGVNAPPLNTAMHALPFVPNS